MLESIGNEPGPFHCIQRRKLTHIGDVLRSEVDTRNNRYNTQTQKMDSRHRRMDWTEGRTTDKAHWRDLIHHVTELSQQDDIE